MSELRDVIRGVVARHPESSVGFSEGDCWLRGCDTTGMSVLDVDGLTNALEEAMRALAQERGI